MKTKTKILILLLLIFIFALPQQVFADTEMDVDRNGNVTHTVVSKKATTGIKWRTIGFWICPNLTPYGDPTSEINAGNAMKVMLDGEYVIKNSKEDQVAGTVTTTYKFNGEYIRDTVQTNPKVNALFENNAKVAYAQGKEPVLYFNSIFQTYQVNSDGSETIRKNNLITKAQISSAEGWAKPNDWDVGHFNIPAYYGMSSAVYLQFTDASGNILENVKVDGKKPPNMTATGYGDLGEYTVGSSQSFNLSRLSQENSMDFTTIESGGKKYSLYRTWYAVKKLPDKHYSDRKYTEGGEYTQKEIANIKIENMAITSMLIVTRYVESGNEVKVRYTDEKGNDLEQVIADGSLIDNPFVKGTYQDGTSVTVKLPDEVQSKGKPYKLVRSYYRNSGEDATKFNDLSVDEGDTLAEVMRQKFTVNKKDVVVVARYKLDTGNNVKIRYTDEGGTDLENVIVNGSLVENPDLYGNYDDGTSVTVNISAKVQAKGGSYELVRSYYRFSEENDLLSDKSINKGNALSDVMKQKFKVGGKDVIVVARYKKTGSGDGGGSENPEPPPGGSNEGDYLTGTVAGVIGSGTRFMQPFDVNQGIPGTESLYADMTAPQYLLSYKLKQETGQEPFTVQVKKNYIIMSMDDKGKPIQTVTPINTTVTVYRNYSYWTIDHFELYTLGQGMVQNGALPAGQLTLPPIGYQVPQATYQKSANKADHVIKPNVPTVKQLPDEIVQNGMIVPEDYQAMIEAEVAKLMVKNDSLYFKGQCVLSNAQTQENGPTPASGSLGEPPATTAGMLYTDGHVIPGTKANGTYSSSGSVGYNRTVNVNGSHAASITLTPTINSVIVHTPVVCPAQIEDMKKYCQLLNPDSARAPLVLDTEFAVTLPAAGTHRNIKGYGYRDYSKYTASRQVCFPFDVYKGSLYVPGGTWTEIGEDIKFYLPGWIKEGDYTIEFRSIPINAYANDGLNRQEEGANLQLQHYTAVKSIPVQVSGRMYDLKIYDITDDIWNDIFWVQKNRLEHSNIFYKTGTKNQNGTDAGINPRLTAPLLKGSHPIYKNAGAAKTGYMIRYQIKTIGSYLDANDYIRIKPRFYYVKSDGTNRQEVDLYYNETFQEDKARHLLVKTGGKADRMNVKSISPDDIKIPEEEMKQSAVWSGKDFERWKKQKVNAYTFGDIRISDDFKTFCGGRMGHLEDLTNAAVEEEKIKRSEQNWYGEYYLPSEVYACPKNFNLAGYCRQKGYLDFNESFWLKEGYIIVNFDIVSIRDGREELSYINAVNAASGWCNMWQMEGAPKQKQDSGGNWFALKDGDFLTFETDKSVQEDFGSGGIY